MAITFSNLGVSATPDLALTTDTTGYATPSWTPPTSGLIILFVNNRSVSAGQNDEPTVTGNGITWTSIASLAGASDARLTLFGANASGSTTGATTISYINTQRMGSASFFHADANVDLTGGVAAAFVQAPTASGNSTTGSVTLASAGHADNRAVFGVRKFVDEAITPRASWTEADEIVVEGRLETQYRSDAFETTASATWTTSGAWIAIAAEIKASAPRRGAFNAPFVAPMSGGF